MNLSTLESIVGPINRGKLEAGFPPMFEPVGGEVPAYLSDDRRMARPPPLTEDLSRLNKPSTKLMSDVARDVWKRMTPEQRRKRREHLIRARAARL